MSSKNRLPVMDLDSEIDLDFNPDTLASEINGIDFPNPQVTPEPDSGLIAYRNMFPVDRLQRMMQEPGSENNPLLQGMEFETGELICNLRGSASLIFEADDEETDDEMSY